MNNMTLYYRFLYSLWTFGRDMPSVIASKSQQQADWGHALKRLREGGIGLVARVVGEQAFRQVFIAGKPLGAVTGNAEAFHPPHERYKSMAANKNAFIYANPMFFVL